MPLRVDGVVVITRESTRLASARRRFRDCICATQGELEDEILDRLANAEGDITEDVELIEGLEETKRISTDITKKSAVAKETQASIEITSKKYKSVADRSSMLFFLMSDLAKIHSYYVYSLAAYTKVFYRGIDLVTDKPEPELDEDGNELPVRVVELDDEELAARCIAPTRRPFLMNELQLWDEGVATISRHLHTIDGAVRESTRDAVVRHRSSTSRSL